MDAHNILQQTLKAPFIGDKDPGASGTIIWDRDRQVTKLTPATGAAETRKLLGPRRSGPEGRLDCTTFVSSSTTTVTVYDSAGGTSGTIAFSAAGQWAKLEAFENASANFEWRVQASYGCTITTIPQVATTANLTSPTISGATIADGTNIALGGTTGTKIGTATSQKLGFFNSAPVVQQTGAGTLVTGATAVNTAIPVSAASTFTGNVGLTTYTISEIVAALKTLGLIAS